VKEKKPKQSKTPSLFQIIGLSKTLAKERKKQKDDCEA